MPSIVLAKQEDVEAVKELIPTSAEDVGALPDTTEALKNPYALTFTGAATGSYDGSEAVEVSIPEEVTVDGAFSSTSTNPVQNSVIYEALSGIYEALEDKQGIVTFATSLSTSTSSSATPYLVKNAINRSTNVSAADTNYSTYMARGEALFSSETTPSYNGQIAWQYE